MADAPGSGAADRPLISAAPVPPGVARLVLVRHGETDYNHEGRWQGAGSDPPLNERGREQARRLAAELAPVPLAAVYASRLERAIESARILAEPHGLEPRVAEGIEEMSHGAWEGKTLAEILEAWADEYAAFESDPWGVSRPGGDSYAGLAERLWPVLDDLAGRHAGERVLVVTHGGPIRLVLSQLGGTPLTERERLGVGNGSWFAVERREGAWRVADSV